MGNSSRLMLSVWGHQVERWVPLFPILLAMLGAVLWAGSAPEAESQEHRSADEPPAPCGVWHRGGGDTRGVDLGAVKRAYADIKKKLESSIEKGKVKITVDQGRGFGGEFPSCRSRQTRTSTLDPEKSLRLRGRKFVFIALGDPDAFSLPEDILRDAETEVLVLRAKSAKDVERVASRLKKQLRLASPEFARALGVTCVPAAARISEKGDSVELVENF